MYKPDVVFYHSPCTDGVSAAGVVYKYYKDNNAIEGIEFAPADYGNIGDTQALINRLRNKHVLLVDFSFKPDVLDAVTQSVASIVILDHHKTAEADLKEHASLHNDMTVGTVESLINDQNNSKALAAFVMEECGASLTWKFFFPGIAQPRFLDYIRDIDLGKMKLDSSPDFRAWSRSYPFDPATFAIFLTNYDTEEKIGKILDAGNAIDGYIQNRIEQMWEQVRFGKVGNVVFPYVFTDYAFSSDAANSFLKKGYKLGIAFYANKHSFGASLRSVKELDCSAIAKQFGGGGHAQAAGFNIKHEDVPGFFEAAIQSGFIENPWAYDADKKDDNE